MGEEGRCVYVGVRGEEGRCVYVGVRGEEGRCVYVGVRGEEFNNWSDCYIFLLHLLPPPPPPPPPNNLSVHCHWNMSACVFDLYDVGKHFGGHL